MSQIKMRQIFDDAFGAGWDEDTIHGASLNSLYDLFSDGEDFLDIYALLAGRAGGQTLIGGTAAGENLTLYGTSHATPGLLDFQSSARLPDNLKMLFGTGSDAAIYYDGADLIIDPQEVGAGVLNISARVNSPSHSVPTKYIQCQVLTAAGINACMAELGVTGGVVDLLENTYDITESIVIPAANITLRGAGAATILDASAAQAFHVINIGAYAYCVIDSLRINGKAGGETAFDLIHGNNSGSLTIKNCWLFNSDQNGISLTTCPNSIIFNNYITNPDLYCIYFDSADDCRVYGNHCSTAPIGIYIYNNAMNNQIFGNRVNACQYGIFLNTSNCTVRDNMLTGCQRGILAFQPLNTIDGNFLSGCGYSANAHSIMIFSNSNTARDNFINNGVNASDDINLTNASGCVVTGNTSFSSAGRSERAIQLVNSPDCIIGNNRSSGHDTCGIEIDAASTGLSIGGNQLLDATPVIDNGSGHEYRVDGGIALGAGSAEGTSYELKIYGYRTGDALRTLEIGVGVDAADTATFNGLGNYLFDGTIKPVGSIIFQTAATLLDLATNGAYFLPRRLSQEAEPTPAAGELLVWHKPTGNRVRLIYNDSTVGVVTVQMI